MFRNVTPGLAVISAAALAVAAPTRAAGAEGRARQPGPVWTRHAIDAGSRGADGVKLADVTGDGLADIATGWEEGGVVRLAVNPGPDRVREPWPSSSVGEARSVEDAAPVDLDGDGAVDLVSACEGSERALHVHWAPRDPALRRDGAAWKRGAFPAARGTQAWMFVTPADIDGRRGIDLFCGGKGQGAAVGWLESPPEPRDLASWRWRALRPAGWVMSLIALDLDRDGDLDLLLSDRKGPRSGVSWLENPRRLEAPRRGTAGAPAVGDPLDGVWPEHPIGAAGAEVMFVTAVDLDADGMMDVVAAVKPRTLVLLRAAAPGGLSWEPSSRSSPEWAGTAKAVAAGDLDLDGRPELVVTCEEAAGERSGVFGLDGDADPWRGTWKPFDIGGAVGTKFDLVELVDLDRDGDLDVLTCEEADGLGVIWYENPARAGDGSGR